jgi:hypothetical protein
MRKRGILGDSYSPIRVKQFPKKWGSHCKFLKTSRRGRCFAFATRFRQDPETVKIAFT